MSPDLEVPSAPHSPWQLFYGAALAYRRRWHGRRAGRLPRPVVSVGNLHWGGAGKTPLVMAVASHLRDAGRHVAVLSRGYGGRGRGVRVVSSGGGPLLPAEVAGDEPVLMARELPDVAVLVCADRHRAGLHALEQLRPAPDLFLLDDGFSHVKLARDVDVLAFPAADPFAGGRLAPAGRLREPLAAAASAEAALLTGAAPPAGESLGRALEPFGFRGVSFASETVALGVRFAAGRPLEPPARVIALSGIARPRPFHRLAREAGFEIVAELVLGDHHAYPEATLDEIRRLWAAHEADALLTTSKDHVKLEGRLELPLAELPVQARPERGFWSWLDRRLAALDTAA